MPKINVLDKHVAELIAAGEVVERPSSVIKELIENSIDAGSSVITIEIRRGGISFMRVTDNGCGIDREDVTVAFLRHATSKVLLKDDLDNIATLGFRGEALASISAVSHVELITKTPGSGIGTRCVCDAGEVTGVQDAGCPEGTTIIVRDLFYNTPARMKFLKKDVTEGNSVAKIIDKIALSHPEISIRFIRDGSEVLHTPGDNKLRSAVYAVLGRDFTNTLMPVDYRLGGIRVYGFTSFPHSSRPNRNMQNFFINGRCVRSKTAIAALEEAYKNSIMVGKFPACVLHMQMDFSQIDVNVHPAKLEIRFVNEKPVFDAVYHAVKSALSSEDKPKVMSIPQTASSGVNRPNNIFSPFAPREKAEQTRITDSVPQVSSHNFKSYTPEENKSSHYSDSLTVKRNSEGFEQHSVLKSAPSSYNTKLIEKIKAEANEGFTFLDEEKSEPDKKFYSKETKGVIENREKTSAPYNEPVINPRIQRDVSTSYIGEAFGTYIILQYGDDKLMLIDKHAAHERILYERIKNSEEGKDAQLLLVPITVTLDKDDYSSVLENLDKLSRSGFDIEDFGEGTVIVRTAPLMLEGTNIADAVAEIAAYLTENKTSIETDYMEWIYSNIACRAAVKEGDKSSREELIAIAKQLEENPDIRYCPHGRPVYMILKKYDIEKQFGRIQ